MRWLATLYLMPRLKLVLIIGKVEVSANKDANTTMATSSSIARNFPDFTAATMGELLKRLTCERHHMNAKITAKQQGELLGVPACILEGLFRVINGRTPLVASATSVKSSNWLTYIRGNACKLNTPVPQYYFVGSAAVLNNEGVVEGDTLTISKPKHNVAAWGETYRAKALAEGAVFCADIHELVQHLAAGIAGDVNEVLANMRKSAGLSLHPWVRGDGFFTTPFKMERNRYQTPVKGHASKTWLPSNNFLVDSMADVQQVVEDFLVQTCATPASASKSATLKPFAVTKSVVSNPESDPVVLPLAQWAFGKGGPLLQAEAKQVLPLLKTVDIAKCTKPELAGKVLALIEELTGCVEYGDKLNTLTLWAR